MSVATSWIPNKNGLYKLSVTSEGLASFEAWDDIETLANVLVKQLKLSFDVTQKTFKFSSQTIQQKFRWYLRTDVFTDTGAFKKDFTNNKSFLRSRLEKNWSSKGEKTLPRWEELTLKLPEYTEKNKKDDCQEYPCTISSEDITNFFASFLLVVDQPYVIEKSAHMFPVGVYESLRQNIREFGERTENRWMTNEEWEEIKRAARKTLSVGFISTEIAYPTEKIDFINVNKELTKKGKVCEVALCPYIAGIWTRTKFTDVAQITLSEIQRARDKTEMSIVLLVYYPPTKQDISSIKMLSKTIHYLSITLLYWSLASQKLSVFRTS